MLKVGHDIRYYGDVVAAPGWCFYLHGATGFMAESSHDYV